MSLFILNDGTAPSAPAAAKSIIFVDSADGRLKRKLPNGTVEVLSDFGRASRQYLSNREFQYAQRQVPGALTAYNSSAARVFSADRWSHTNENSGMQFVVTDSTGSPETNLRARFYGQFKKTTNQGKIEVFQIVESRDSQHLRGRTVRFSMKARNTTGSHTLRLAILEGNPSGTADSNAGTTVTAHGAAGADPTFGGGFGRVAPVLCSTNATIAGNGVTCILSGNWQTFSGTFVIPAACKNVTACVFTDNRMNSNDAFGLTEMSLTEGDEEQLYVPTEQALDYLACLRFYQKSFDQGAAPDVAAGIGNAYTWFNVIAGAVTRVSPTILLNTPMRTGTPTINLFSPTTGSAVIWNDTAGSDANATALQFQTDRMFVLVYTGSAGWSVADQLYIAWSADAEI